VAIQSAHRHETQKEVILELADESDGTRRLLDLMPALYMLKTDTAVYFIDEIDRSMHPMLVYKFLEYFLSICKHAPCQIIVTTHESHLLDLDLLRRDEIWFAEKDRAGATNLYSLTDFNVRKDLHIQKGYLEGRFGAVPFLGDIDRLIEKQPGGTASATAPRKAGIPAPAWAVPMERNSWRFSRARDRSGLDLRIRTKRRRAPNSEACHISVILV
jgi:AAA15 family ATPase/GTPase